ncbi:MAG: glycosyltransferase, partial [Acidobacteriota bacterium]
KRQGPADFLRTLRCAHQADCILIQKKLFSQWKLRLLVRAAPLIFDMDDASFATSRFELESYAPRKARRRTSRRQRRLAAVLTRSRRVIAGNGYLADYARRFAHDVVVVPTAVDLSAYPRHRLTDKPDTGVTIGWIGSSPSLPYLAQLRDPLARIFARFKNVRMVQICDAFAELPGVPCAQRQWSLDREPEDLLSLDIGLMPLTDDPFARGKCALKILQYFAAGAAVVCSPVGANLEVASDPDTALFASSAEEWESHIARLIEHPPLRRAMRNRAREVVEKAYSAEVVGPRLAELIQSVKH